MNYYSEKETTKYVVTYESDDFAEVMEAATKKFWYFENSFADKVKIEPDFYPARNRTNGKKDLCRVRVIAYFTKPIKQQIGEFTV